MYAADKDVLNIGMGGYLESDIETKKYFGDDATVSFHGQIAKVSRTITGIDLNTTALDIMKKKVPGKYFSYDITDPELPEKLGMRFECVLMGEVLRASRLLSLGFTKY